MDVLNLETDDPIEKQLNCELDMKEAEVGEYTFQKIEEFGTLVNVPYDGNCGYNAVIGALQYIKRCCRENVKEFRRDIRNYVENHRDKDKFTVVNEDDLNSIFQ